MRVLIRSVSVLATVSLGCFMSTGCFSGKPYIPPGSPGNVPATVGSSAPALAGTCLTLTNIVTVLAPGSSCPSPGNNGGSVPVASATPVTPTNGGPSGGSSPTASQTQCQGSAAKGTKGTFSYAGGPLIGCANVVVLCLNAPCKNFGGTDPCVFWNDLDQSQMIHIADAYVGQTGNNRYQCQGQGTEVDGVPTGILSDQQVLNIINAHLNGTGVNALYNVIMTPAQYGDSSSCSAHTNGQSAQGTVYYSEITDGCGYYSGMEHEMFEMITDPENHTGWTNPNLGQNGVEIGDACENTDTPTNLSGTTFSIQSMWSINQSKCVFAPP